MKGLRKLAVLGAFALAGIAGLGSSAAKADFIPTLVAISGTSGDFTFTYSVSLTVDEQGATGAVPTFDASGKLTNPSTTAAFFTIYDFQGFTGIADVTMPANWAVMSPAGNLGVTPPNVSPTDSALLPNVTFYYVGPPNPLNPTTFLVSMETNNTNALVNINGFFTSFANKTSGGVDQNIGPVDVPDSQGQVFGPAPATAWAGIVLLGLLGLGYRVRKALA